MEPATLVYLAGPLGFTEAGRLYHETVLRPAVVDAGFEPLDPWETSAAHLEVLALPAGDPRRARRLPDVNREIGRRNAEMIRACTAVLAVLDGTDVDSGTAAEIGFAAALARPVIGLRMDLRVAGDNEATTVNLQVEWFVEQSGGRLARNLPDAIAGLRAVSAGEQTR